MHSTPSRVVHCSDAVLLLLSTDNKKMNGLHHGVTENGHAESKQEEREKGDDEALVDGEKKTNGASSDNEKDEQEVVFIQDMGFTVKIVSPGTESFDIQVRHSYFLI